MKIQHIILALALLAMPFSTSAQKKKPAPQKKAAGVKKPVKEEPEEDPRIMEMLEATQQIVFIDSVIVDKKDFLKAYNLTPEVGLLQSYNEFFNSTEGTYNTVYRNELGNKCYFSKSGRLYTSDLLGSEWSSPMLLEGFGTFDRLNYPFMMTDGTTFYFAAMGEQSLGGLDIFRTRFDSGSGRFLKAENIGMPFNSEANDYMFVIDEIDSIGYFATDRRQPEGKVCIYSFIPTETRHTYDIDELGESRIRSLARIDRIKDTWINESECRQALARLQSLRTAEPKKKSQGLNATAFAFIVNDQTTYTKYEDFLATGNAERFRELQTMKNELENLTASLLKARADYAVGSDEQRAQMAARILESEQQQELLEATIHKMEKAIRLAETEARGQ